MHSRRQFIAGLSLSVSQLPAGAKSQTPDVSPNTNRIQDRFLPAPFAAQRLGGILGDRMAVNEKCRLLEGVDVDLLLAGYRQRPGRQTWIGEHAAKFIDAATNSVAYSGNTQLQRKLDDTVTSLISTQLEDGYLGTYLETARWKDWDLWAHKYNLIALLNYHRATGSEPALEACRRMADLILHTYGPGPGQRSIVRGDWHHGMANTSILEGIVLLHRATGDARYLDFANYIVQSWELPDGPRILSTLESTSSVQRVANAKAYEMTSNLVGLLELYRTTGETRLLRGVLAAWEDIVKNRLYRSGTASWDEHFLGAGMLRADDLDVEAGVGEGCVTTTWMQMNLQLLRLTGEARFAVELERTVYNAVLAAQHPVNGRVCYFVALNGMKQYGKVSHGVPGVSCCTSSIPRAISLIPAVAWGTNAEGPVIHFYGPGSARLGAVFVRSETNFPADGAVDLHIQVDSPATHTLSLLVPAWTSSFLARVAGKEYRGTPGSYLQIRRHWEGTQHVRIEIDLSPRVVSGAPAYPDYFAIERGPQLLAADLSLNPKTELWLAALQANPKLEPVRSFPSNWAGSQAYTAGGGIGNSALGWSNRRLVLTPLADAGQLGGEYRVWFRKAPTNGNQS
jgi:DUF1680 family protein